jgi:FkbM family methyltransferase
MFGPSPVVDARLSPRVWLGESLRWYVTRARHPFKDYVVGHYWSWFCKPRIWITYDGTAAINVCLGDYLQGRIFAHGYYERPLVDWLRRTLRPTDVFWDVGANIGAVTLVAARLVTRVVAFEPDPRSLVLLRRNLSMNRLGNVEVVPAALGDRAGTATLHQGAASNTGMSSLVAGGATTAGDIPVTVTRVDDVLATRADLAPQVMKLDVEGAEHLVVRGATRLLRSGQLRALVFEDRTDPQGHPTNAALVGGLVEAGYDIRPLGVSDESAADGLCNFVATRATGDR